jgi:5'-3' exonuclease
MGIPSYYKRLIDRFPALVKKGIRAETPLKADRLYMDFNCLIYYCLKSQPPYAAAAKDEWEKSLIEAVKKYTVHVWEVAGRPRHVFIGVDGVVPMAKIRQQRLRRFKSVWLAAAEREVGARVGESWDSNSITPGTAFMEALGAGLRSLGEARGWKVSDASEPGEGEQKLMAEIRREGSGRIVVYGLDADLIVLSLLGLAEKGAESWHLLREGGEFGAAADTFATLDAAALLKIIVPKGWDAKEFVHEYICAMSFLGNDFLPHSLTVKIRDGGHDEMRRQLEQLHAAGKRLVVNGAVEGGACADFLVDWAFNERQMLTDAIEHKYSMRPMVPRSDTERLMVGVQNLPVEWKEDLCLFYKGALRFNWEEIYYSRWLRGAAAEQVCAEYIKGLQWILDYYTGKPISYSWYFPWNVPPLWADLKVQIREAVIKAAPVSSPVAPQQQLAMVLPQASWGLVRDLKLKGLPAAAPAFWPRTFSFFSAGRRWMWECEPEIPVMSVERMIRACA